MHEYYFKIRKDDIEFEFSTTDKFTFEQQLSDWINGIVRGDYVALPANSNDDEALPNQERSGFINVKNLTSINEITTPLADITTTETKEHPVDIDFAETLEESMLNPKTEVKEKSTNQSEFGEYLQSYNPQTLLDNLIVTAKYILGVENQERFTIKQINAKLVPALGTPVDHGVIEDALNQNLIKLVPDLTGTCDFTEYTLTDEGEHYFIE